MKTITLKQPWATLVALGYKTYEFRSWQTSYRGELLIHAGQGIDKEAMDKFKNLNLTYPKSRILAKCTVVDCLPITKELNEKITKENNFIYGHKGSGTGYAWKLDNIKPLDIKKEVKGRLSLWDFDLTKQ